MRVRRARAAVRQRPPRPQGGLECAARAKQVREPWRVRRSPQVCAQPNPAFRRRDRGGRGYPGAGSRAGASRWSTAQNDSESSRHGRWMDARRRGAGSDRRHYRGRGPVGARPHGLGRRRNALRGMRRGDSRGAPQGAPGSPDLRAMPIGARPQARFLGVQSARKQGQPAALSLSRRPPLNR